MPVDPSPSARVAGPLPHLRKLAFLFGAVLTFLALMVIKTMVGGAA